MPLGTIAAAHILSLPGLHRHLRPHAVGLHHLAFRVGADLDALRSAKTYFDDRGIEVHRILDHVVSQGIYLNDPDGHLLELYVDADAALWRTTPSLVANSGQLRL